MLRFLSLLFAKIAQKLHAEKQSEFDRSTNILLEQRRIFSLYDVGRFSGEGLEASNLFILSTMPYLEPFPLRYGEYNVTNLKKYAPCTLFS